MEAVSLSDTDPAPPLGGGRYRLREVLGTGGMATVYRAYDDKLDVDRAIKVLNPNLMLSEVMRARFQDEARTLARLRHPHIVAVHDFGQDQSRLYMVMEYLPGGSLERRLRRRGPLYPRDATLVMLSVLSALEEVHRLGVVHRDVKPANVLLDRDGTPKLADFGIAHLQDSKKTRHGAAVGTWAYMAPEQRSNARAADLRADIYGAGATLFSLLTTEEPQDLDRAEHHQEALDALPPILREIILRATQYKPGDRYATVTELRAALTTALGELPPAPPGAPPIVSIAPVERELGVERFRLVPDTPDHEIHPELDSFPGAGGHSAIGAPIGGDTAVPIVEPILRPLLDEGPTTFELTRRRMGWRRAAAWVLLVGAVAFVLAVGAYNTPTADTGHASIVAADPRAPLDGSSKWVGEDGGEYRSQVPVRGVDGDVAIPGSKDVKREPTTSTTLPPLNPNPESPDVVEPEAPVTYATLKIRSDPRADLFIDGEPSESVDVVAQLRRVESGPHTVELRSAVGNYTWTVDLAPDATRSLCALLREGRQCP